MSKRRAIPRFDHPLIETHCHLDYLKQAPVEEIIARAREAGVERIVTIGVDPDNLGKVRALARQFDSVFGTQGIHPHEAERFDDDVAARIGEGIGDSKIVAVGEIGLDYYYDNADRGVQRAVFARQLGIAAEAGLPVVIHTRDAEDDTRAILQEHAGDLDRRGVIHSFTSSPELAEFCVEAGFCLGFNGIITFRNADNVRAVVEITPLDRMLVETDSPFLTPVPYRGKENAPFYIPFVAEKIAEVKQLDIDEVLPVLYGNAMKLFWPDRS